MNYMLVFIGGGLGCLTRYAFSHFMLRYSLGALPLGTLGVNVLGSFFMGVLAALVMENMPSHSFIRHFLMVGFLGGFTTFSSFSLDVANLQAKNDYMAAGVYIALSVVVSIAALFFGMWLMRQALAQH